MTERSDNLSSGGSILTPREQVNLWLRKLELEAEENPWEWARYEKFMYLSTIHVITTQVIGSRKRAFMKQPLSVVIAMFDQQIQPDEEKLMCEDVESGCATTAREWLQYHPDSARARLISEQGLQAALGYHAGLLIEMFSDFQKSR